MEKLRSFALRDRNKKIFGWLLFFSAIILYYQKVELPQKITSRPRGEHVWAQCDRASMALTYHMDKAPFFLPRCHQATNNPEGITAGEFPLVPYLVAKLYDVFGFNEMFFRLVICLTAILGFIFSHLIVRTFLHHWFWSFFIAVIWFASPNIIYYSFSFLPDVTGLSLILISTYFLVKNKSGPSYTDLSVFFLFFALAGLVRVSSIVPLCGIAFAFFITGFKSKLPGTQKKIFYLTGGLIALLITCSWIYYARWILLKYGIFTFLLQPMPPTSKTEWLKGVDIFLVRRELFYIREYFYVLGAFTIAALFFIRKTNWFLLLSTIFIYLGFALMFYVLFQKGFEHPYYWVTFQAGIFFHVLWIADSLKHLKLNRWVHLTVAMVALVFINFNAIHIHKNVERRWNDYPGLYDAYYKLEPYIASIGIKYGDRVLSYNDPTFNNRLYLMNRKGWSISKEESQDHLKKAFESCQYAVLNDTTILHDPVWGSYFHQQIGEHEGLLIYEIRPD